MVKGAKYPKAAETSAFPFPVIPIAPALTDLRFLRRPGKNKSDSSLPGAAHQVTSPLTLAL